MTTKSYSIPAIHCMHCTHTIQMELGELEGVKDVHADVENKKVEVTFEAPASEDVIEKKLNEIGYPPAGQIS